MRQHRLVSANESDFRIRLATTSDAAIIGWHRARMWQDMGDVPSDLFESLRAKAGAYLAGALASGDYIGWLATPADAPETVIAGAGIYLRKAMPHPLKRGGTTVGIAEGRLGTVLNVYTEPEWRQRGVASLLMQRVIRWSRDEGLDGLTLHAANAGRALYEKLGFVGTNEMRLND